MRELLILGNGFDLSCDLASRYQDFFDWRMKNLFGTTNFNEIREILEAVDSNVDSDKYDSDESYSTAASFNYQKRISSSISTNPFSPKKVDYTDYFSRKKEGYWKQFVSLTRWDVVFIYAQKYLRSDELKEWQDIENIINNVVEIALSNQKKNKWDLLDEVHTNLHYSGNGEEEFRKIVFKYTNCGNPDPHVIARNLLANLNDFEEIFSQYIYTQMKVNEDNSGHFSLPYFCNAKQLLKQISGLDKRADKDNKIELNVLSFNYTLGPRFKTCFSDLITNNGDNQDIKIESWNNIHGLACYKDSNAVNAIKRGGTISGPIFGIDPQDSLSIRRVDNSPRVIFTKPYRLIVNKIENIRKDINFKGMNRIIIYGHSLGEADSSYFTYIFDHCKIYSENVRLIFYYWPGNKIEEQQEKEIEFTEKVVDFLNAYGKTSDLARKDIVTRLILEGRLTILPNPQIIDFQKVK